MLPLIVCAISHQLDTDKGIDRAGILHVDVGFHAPAAVKPLRHFASNLGGKEFVLNRRVFCAQPCKRAADGQRKKEYGRNYHGR